MQDYPGPVAYKYVAACMEAHVCMLFYFVPVHNGSVFACVCCCFLLGLFSVFFFAVVSAFTLSMHIKCMSTRMQLKGCMIVPACD